MGGALDSSRFKYFLSQAIGCNANEVEGMVIPSLTSSITTSSATSLKASTFAHVAPTLPAPVC